jgi:hypothetical protein
MEHMDLTLRSTNINYIINEACATNTRMANYSARLRDSPALKLFGRPSTEDQYSNDDGFCSRSLTATHPRTADDMGNPLSRE